MQTGFHTNTATAPAERVSAMLLPIDSDFLILPDVAVMQIVDAPTVEGVENSPDWFAGNMLWRGYSVPVVRFEPLNGGFARSSSIERVAIIKSTVKNGYLPYYAVATSDRPSLRDINIDSVVIAEGRARGRAESMSIALDDIAAGVPNADWVENHLLTYILHN